jgi:hypothetical protein
MKNKAKLLISRITTIVFILIASLHFATPAYAQTAEWNNVCVGGANNDVATIQGLECLIANIFTVIISLIGLTAFVMFIVGSVQWLMSGGNPEGTKKARDTLTYAVIGIVVALSAFIVLNLISGFTGVEEIQEFKIPTSGLENE